MRRVLVGVLLTFFLAGCGAGKRAQHREAPVRTALPAAPISARSLGLNGRIAISNGWEGVVTGQLLRVAAGRYRSSGQGVALVSDEVDLEREVPAPPGEGALRFVRRVGRQLELRSHAGHRFSLSLRTLRLTRLGRQAACPSGALRGPRPRLLLRFTPLGLRPLPAPKSDQLAVLLAILAAVHGRVMAVEAHPATHAPCGLAARSLAARVSIATPRPIVSVVRRTVFVSRFSRGWRAWRVQG